MKNIIVAGSKPWNKEIFETFTKKKKLNWFFVSTPAQLDSVLVKISKPDFLFFLHWNWKVSSEIIKKHECVCFHITDLPFGRGGSPLQNLILNGNKETMISAFKMVEELDAGPIYIKKPLLLNGRAEDIYRTANNLSLEIMIWIIENKPSPVTQNNNPTYFNRRGIKESLLPLNSSLSSIYDFIRMLDAPTYPKAYINYGDLKFEFSHSNLKNDFIEAKVIIKKDKFK